VRSCGDNIKIDIKYGDYVWNKLAYIILSGCCEYSDGNLRFIEVRVSVLVSDPKL